MWTRQDIAWPTTIRGTTATAIDRVGIIRPSTIITSRGREEAEEEVVTITATVDEAVVAAVEVVTVAVGRTITHTEEEEEEVGEDTSKEDPSRISTRIGTAEWPVGVEEEVDNSIRAAIVVAVVDTRAKVETTVTGAVVEDKGDKEDRDKAGATRTRTTSNAAINLKYN